MEDRSNIVCITKCRANVTKQRKDYKIPAARFCRAYIRTYPLHCMYVSCTDFWFARVH